MAIDPIIKDHQLWIGFVQPEGLVVSPHALKNAQAVLSHSVGGPQETLRRLAVLDPDGHLHLENFPTFTREFWNWRESDLAAPPDELAARLSEYGESLRPTWVVRGGKGQAEHLILVEELPSGTDFDKAGLQSEERRWLASPQARFERLLRETGVSIGLLISPERIRLVYAPKGESSGHATFPIHEMTMAPNWPMLAALHLLLHSDRLFIGPENQRLPAILEASRRYQNEVSIRLAGQVLRALNELVRGFQEADRAAHGGILGEALRHDPNHIYGGMLTTLMRMIFVLYAEDRSMMGSDETWLQNYSISGLYERLRADAGQYPDTMDSRYGAWALVVTLTRLLYDGGGHRSWRLPPRHGELFDPDAYPFLEGRTWESKRSATTLIEPPLVSDGTIFRILQDLLYLDGERISYRALDVEQIGSVYEAMMGFTVETAHGASIGLGSNHLVVNLERLLTEKPTDRQKWLKENADCEVTGKAVEQLKTAASIDELLAGLRRRISKLYLDQNSNPVAISAGGIYLQPTEERRRSGSHYTPRSLTQPIVKTTLDPVVAQLGDNPTPEQILELKVCDPAMGSGAFLVEVCRYLGEKLEKAWNAHNCIPVIPSDQDPLLHARRIVTQRCLYGVDKNPFAVNLAKLSLWLATFAKDHPFTFVDHTLRCGDSLIGLTARQIEVFHWRAVEEGALLRDLPSRLRHILNSRVQILDAADETSYETLAQKLANTEEQVIDLRLAGNLLVAAFLGRNNPKQREDQRKDLEEKYRLAQVRITDIDLKDELKSIVRAMTAGLKGVSPFHWELEFPEVFRIDEQGRRTGGFDSLIGNPPFLGGTKISTSFGDAYLKFLTTAFSDAGNRTDLVAYFFRESFDNVRRGGTCGLIATNTIAQGDTRKGSLRWIRKYSGTIFDIRKRLRWPGRAAVVVSVVCFAKDLAPPARIDGQPVPLITAYLVSHGGDDDPLTLRENNNQRSEGFKLASNGFVFDDGDERANPLAEKDSLFLLDPKYKQIIRPYIGGDELNDDPEQNYHRWAINFGRMSEKEAGQWPEALDIVRRRVKPYRDDVKRASHRLRWWQYGEVRPGLIEGLRGKERVLCNSRVSGHLFFAYLPTTWIFAESLNIFFFDSNSKFSVLQSRVHEIWARFFGSSMKDDLRYTPSDCFENFPFPPACEDNLELKAAGQTYYEFRSALMRSNNEGLTKTYNRFHNPNETSADIHRLRNLHDTMDRAVLVAYGWSNLHPAPEFFPEFELEKNDDSESSRAPAKKYRFRWSERTQDEILARLLELNRTRAEEEGEIAGPDHVSKVATTPTRRSGKQMQPLIQGTLYKESTE